MIMIMMIQYKQVRCYEIDKLKSNTDKIIVPLLENDSNLFDSDSDSDYEYDVSPFEQDSEYEDDMNIDVCI